jgi:hypothetical protein
MKFRNDGYVAVDPATQSPVTLNASTDEDGHAAMVIYAPNKEEVQRGLASVFGDEWAYGTDEYPPRLRTLPASITWEDPEPLPVGAIRIGPDREGFEIIVRDTKSGDVIAREVFDLVRYSDAVDGMEFRGQNRYSLYDDGEEQD